MEGTNCEYLAPTIDSAYLQVTPMIKTKGFIPLWMGEFIKMIEAEVGWANTLPSESMKNLAYVTLPKIPYGAFAHDTIFAFKSLENTKGFSPFPQPIPPEQISDKYDRIEDHLRHTLETIILLLIADELPHIDMMIEPPDNCPAMFHIISRIGWGFNSCLLPIRARPFLINTDMFALFLLIPIQDIPAIVTLIHASPECRSTARKIFVARNKHYSNINGNLWKFYIETSDRNQTKGYDQAIHRYCLDIRYVTVYLNTYGTLKELEMKNTPELSGKT
ncbi:2474_t:CDS:2 [Rhizophagus irregularis]|nr:2474_t:CDS:2 [Rhizophagus irregularis]